MRTKFSRRDPCFKIGVCLVAILVAVLPCSAQFNFLDPLGLTGVSIGNGTITLGPPPISRIPQMLQELPQQAALYFLNPVGGALSIAIRQARNNARQNCGPVFQQVIDALTPFIDPSVFNGLCWTSLRPGIGLDTLVIKDGGMAAVTLDDTIVFKDSASGFKPDLWAHELIHVLQYRRLGVEGFANIYSFDWNSLEREAYAFQDFVNSRLNVQPSDANWRQQYYETQADWNPNSRIPDQEFVQQARLTINPLSCTRVERVNNFAQIFNDCPIAFRIVDFTALNLQTGQMFSFLCQGETCIVQPGFYDSVPDPPGLKLSHANMMW
jgi:Domain of unknown function (DUF4157)